MLRSLVGSEMCIRDRTKSACVSAKPCHIYRQKEVPENETMPRVENRCVGSLNCCRNASIAAFSRQYQGPRSLILVRGFAALREPSRYAQIRVFSSIYSSDVRKGQDSMYLLEDLLLGLQECGVNYPKMGLIKLLLPICPPCLDYLQEKLKRFRPTFYS